MNEEAYDKLTAAEKKMAVAQLDGCVFYHGTFIKQVSPNGRQTKKHGVPDYLNDLNACHHFEKEIPELIRWKYDQAIRDQVNPNYLTTAGVNYGIIHATAEQRCKAFVMIMTEEIEVEP